MATPYNDRRQYVENTSRDLIALDLQGLTVSSANQISLVSSQAASSAVNIQTTNVNGSIAVDSGNNLTLDAVNTIVLTIPVGGGGMSFINNEDAIVMNTSGGDGDIVMTTNSVGTITLNTDNLGFYRTAPITKPTVTGLNSGSGGANAALTSLLTQLANLGLVTDSTT